MQVANNYRGSEYGAFIQNAQNNAENGVNEFGAVFEQAQKVSLLEMLEEWRQGKEEVLKRLQEMFGEDVGKDLLKEIKELLDKSKLEKQAISEDSELFETLRRLQNLLKNGKTEGLEAELKKCLEEIAQYFTRLKTHSITAKV